MSCAWIGWAVPLIARRDGVVAAVAGAFYNLDELVGDDAAAAALALYDPAEPVSELVRVNGDFALVVYDAATRRLVLARDKLGTRPLYFAETSRGLAFGTRPRALLALPGVADAPNARWLATFAGGHYRAIDNRESETPYAAIRQVPAAHALVYEDGAARLVRYWDLYEQDVWATSEGELAEEYRELLLDAAGRRVRQFARPAFTLSGGLDSSSVLSCAAIGTGEPQNAYSVTYEDRTYDESHEIRDMLETRVARWTPVHLDDAVDVFTTTERMVAVHDEPVATATWLAHFVLAERASADGVDALFGGLGGDELNAGEYEYFPMYFADLQRAGLDQELEVEIDAWARLHDHPVFRKDRARAFQQIGEMTDAAIPGRCLLNHERHARYRDAVDPDYFDLASYTPSMAHPFTSYLSNRAYQDLFRETTPCCLRAQDRHAGAFGFASVSPFLDHRVVEFMFRVPARSKIRSGVTKKLLREAMRGVLPEETRTRVKKVGWNAPAHLWFCGESGSRLEGRVRGGGLDELGVYRSERVLELLHEHQRIVSDGRASENHMMFLWQLLNVLTWFDYLRSAPWKRAALSASIAWTDEPLVAS